MAKLFGQLHRLAAVFAMTVVVAALFAIATPASAQQPSTVNPNASAEQERQLLQDLNRI